MPKFPIITRAIDSIITMKKPVEKIALIPAESFAPAFWAVTIAVPTVKPIIMDIIRKRIAPVAPTAASASLLTNFPPTIVSTIVYKILPQSHVRPIVNPANAIAKIGEINDVEDLDDSYIENPPKIESIKCLGRVIDKYGFKDGDKLKAKTLETDKDITVLPDTPVSMNMFAFTPTIFKYLEILF